MTARLGDTSTTGHPSASAETEVARWLAETGYEDLPPDVVELMKTLVFVIGGCVVAGGTADGSEEVVDLVRGWGGEARSTVLVHGGRVPAHAAVLANSTMARAYDICDFIVAGTHLGSSVVPVALAVAEAVGGASGKDLLAALAVGCEFGARLARVSRLGGFDPSGVITGFTTAIVAGRLMKLDSDQMLHALSIAFNRAAGSFQSNVDGSLAVRLIQGFSSQNGVVCAELAARGMTGPRDYLGGQWGYYALFGGGVNGDEQLTGRLGEQWHVRAMGFKKYPSCGGTLVATEAALRLRDNPAFRLDEVESVTVRMAGALQFGLVGHRFEPGRYPTVNGQFTASYCVANALLRGFPELAHFSPERVTDPVIGALIEKVTVVHDPELAEGRFPSRVRLELDLTSGGRLVELVDELVGGPTRPLTRAELVDDFWTRTAFGGIPLPDPQLAAFLAGVETLERSADATEFVPLLVRPRL